MLTGSLSKDGVSINISGDVSDFQMLQNTISKVIRLLDDHKLTDTSASHLFVNFFEKIEKVCTKTALDYDAHPRLSPSCSITGHWVDVLMALNILTSLSAYIIADELDNINLLSLEYILKDIADNAPAKSLNRLKKWIGMTFIFGNLNSFIKGFPHDTVLANEPIEEVILSALYSKKTTN